MRVRAPQLARLAAPVVLSALALGLSLLTARADPAIERAFRAEGPRQRSAETELHVTLAATGEDVDAADAAPAAASSVPLTGGLTIEITVANLTGVDLAGLQVRAPVPSRTRVFDSWLGEPGTSPGTPQGQFLVWRDLALQPDGRLGPVHYRLVPEPAADGALIFHEARLRPQITWSRPSPGVAAVPDLRLNGLWGEASLRRTVLPNGLTILTRERPDSDTVAIRFAVRAGSRDEDDGTSGGSHWLEHAHFLGTTRRSGDELASAIADVGGQSNAATSWEATDYWHWVPAEHFDLALDVLADQLVNSTFREEAFDRERSVVFEELKRRVDTPSIRALDEFITLVFQVSPLRRHPAGTIESVQSIPVPTMLAYRNERYVTGNVAIAAVGNLRHEEVVTNIATAFAGLPQRSRGERPSIPEPIQTQLRVVEIGEGVGAAEIRLGWSAPGETDPQGPVMYLITDILGATGRRLTEEIRDRRALARSVSSTYVDFSDAGALMISASTVAANVDQVVELILAEIGRLRAGDVAEEEVEASLRAIAGRRSVGEESNQQQTGRAREEVSSTLWSGEEHVARLRRVTPSDIQRVAEAYFNLDHYTLVVVRP